MQIELTSIGQVYVDKKLEKLELHYLRDGKPSKRLLVNVADSKDVFQKVRGAKVGDKFDIELRKDGEFYNWIGANQILSDYPEAAAAPAKGVPAVAKSTYETSEERAARQVFIVRQSSIANAIAFHASTEVQPRLEDIIKTAKEFEVYVFGKALAEEIKDDIPY